MKIPYTPNDPNNIHYADGILVRRDTLGEESINIYADDKWVFTYNKDYSILGDTQMSIAFYKEFVDKDSLKDAGLRFANATELSRINYGTRYPDLVVLQSKEEQHIAEIYFNNTDAAVYQIFLDGQLLAKRDHTCCVVYVKGRSVLLCGDPVVVTVRGV